MWKHDVFIAEMKHLSNISVLKIRLVKTRNWPSLILLTEQGYCYEVFFGHDALLEIYVEKTLNV